MLRPNDKSEKVKGFQILTLIALFAAPLLLSACDSAGAGGGGGSDSAVTCESVGPGSGGNVILMASGTYANDPNDLEFSIQYSWIDPGSGTQSDAVFEDEISLPWTTSRTLDAGAGVSINIIGQEEHSNSMTLSICEDGSLVAEHSINEVVSSSELQPPASLTHVVGQ